MVNLKVGDRIILPGTGSAFIVVTELNDKSQFKYKTFDINQPFKYKMLQENLELSSDWTDINRVIDDDCYVADQKYYIIENEWKAFLKLHKEK